MASAKLGLIGSPGAPSSPVASAKLQNQTVASLKTYCDRWTNVFRGLSAELKVLSDSYVKWMSYDQSSQLQTAGSKWTKEEEDLLRYAVSVYGDDMPKICETLNSRSEQAIRAAIKRKVDPAVLEQIGPKRKKKGHIAEDTSPLASYTNNGSAEANSADEDSDARVEPSSGSSSEPPRSSTGGWFLKEAGVELTDQDFLALLEDDQTILEGGMSMAGIPQIPSIRSPDEFKPEHMLVERATIAQDFIFLNNYKADMRQIADDLRVYRAKSIKSEQDAASLAPAAAKTQILLNSADDPADPNNEVALAQLEQILFGGHQDYALVEEERLVVPSSSSTDGTSSEAAQTTAVDPDLEAATAAEYIEGLM